MYSRHWTAVGDGCCCEANAVNAIAQTCGFESLDAAAIRQARALAVSLLGEGIAPVCAYEGVAARVGGGLFGFREAGALTGLNASFPLNAAGLAALQAARFDTINIDVELLARPGERPAAYYGWGLIASTRAGAAAVMRLSYAIHRALYWATPTFARVLTADGRRACARMGFVAASTADPTLVWIPPGRYAPALSP